MDKINELLFFTEFSPIYGIEGAKKVINQLKQVEEWTREYARTKRTNRDKAIDSQSE